MAYGVKYMDGFRALTEIPTDLTRRLPVQSSVTIAKGDVLKVAAGTGYAELATTLAAADTLFYVALEPVSSQTVAGAVEVLAVPILAPVLWMAPVSTNAVLAQATHVGQVFNLDGSEDGLTNAASLTTYYGFRCHEIDISTEAVAVNTYGYAIGSFEVLPKVS